MTALLFSPGEGHFAVSSSLWKSFLMITKNTFSPGHFQIKQSNNPIKNCQNPCFSSTAEGTYSERMHCIAKKKVLRLPAKLCFSEKRQTRGLTKKKKKEKQWVSNITVLVQSSCWAAASSFSHGSPRRCNPKKADVPASPALKTHKSSTGGGKLFNLFL